MKEKIKDDKRIRNTAIAITATIFTVATVAALRKKPASTIIIYYCLPE